MFRRGEISTTGTVFSRAVPPVGCGISQPFGWQVRGEPVSLMEDAVPYEAPRDLAPTPLGAKACYPCHTVALRRLSEPRVPRRLPAGLVPMPPRLRVLGTAGSFLSRVPGRRPALLPAGVTPVLPSRPAPPCGLEPADMCPLRLAAVPTP